MQPEHKHAGLRSRPSAQELKNVRQPLRDEDDYFDVAEICPNGHVSSTMAASYPTAHKPFCDKCGEATITTCPACNESIRGYRHIAGVIGGFDYEPPSYCYNCGAAFPWTERRKQAAIDLFVDEIQDKEDRRIFAESIEQITRDTPQAQVASNRIVRLLGKVGPGTASAIRDILVDTASEFAKTILFPKP